MSRRAPLILISSTVELKGREFGDAAASLSMCYALAVQAAGGVPWIVPALADQNFVAESVRRCDGVMLSGGDDIHPDLYTAEVSEELRRTLILEPRVRDLFELMLIAEVFRQRKPLLAICRGAQMLNVALGGSLWIDLGLQVKGALDHAQKERKDQTVHEVEIAPGSLLARIVQRHRLAVNSSHHQAVAEVSKTLRVTAVSRDGTIEGLELASAGGQNLPFLLAVQFHPERLYGRHAEHLALFEGFVQACLSDPTRPL